MNELQTIIAFINRYIQLTDDEIAIIRDQNIFRSYPKNSVLLREGQHATECFFILKGCVRKYYLVDGEERNTDFYFENTPITPVSYVTKEPSGYYLATLDETIVAIGSDQRNNQLMERIPKLAGMISSMTMEQIIQSESDLDQFKTLSPENRYLLLIRTRPDIFERVPLYHIATYLGITPVSLSRMRKRLAKS